MSWFSDRHAFVRQGDRPHFFKVVKGAHLRSEQVHDNVARIDQNPIAPPQTFDPTAAAAFVFQPVQQMLRNRIHLAA